MTTEKMKETPELIKLDFDWPIKNIAGQHVLDAYHSVSSTLGETPIAGLGTEKACNWAKILLEKKCIQVDLADYKILKNWFKGEQAKNLIRPYVIMNYIEFFEKMDKENNIA